MDELLKVIRNCHVGTVYTLENGSWAYAEPGETVVCVEFMHNDTVYEPTEEQQESGDYRSAETGATLYIRGNRQWELVVWQTDCAE